MEKKYIIVRLDDNNYWGYGDWTPDIKEAQFFNNRSYAESRIQDKDLIGSEEVFQEGEVWEVREVFTNR